MSDSRRSRLSIDIPTEEQALIKMWAASQKRSISDFVLSCVRERMPCRLTHEPNDETATTLRESRSEKDVLSFDSPLEMFKYLGLPTTCLDQSFPKASDETLKKQNVKKKI